MITSCRKIVITGPECTGKTTLSRQLAELFRTVWVPEFARQWLETFGPSYQQADLLTIAEGQLKAEDQNLMAASEFIFFDTSLEVIKIWSEYRFGSCHPWILHQLNARRPDLYLLCSPDLEWKPDPLRENPHDRHLLFELYRKDLLGSGIPVAEISGKGHRRLHCARNAILTILPSK